MDRRRFLQWAGAAIAAGTVFDPEKLLWVPGAKTYFIPDPTLVVAETITDALRLGLCAHVPNGHGGWATIELLVRSEAQLAAEIASIRALGGRVMGKRRYQAVTL